MATRSNTGDLLGRIFDRRYRVNELIGSGGMGSVYRATHLEMNREVALKVLERGIADSDKQVQRFYQEARASSRLQHPNTIRVFDFGRAEDGRLYLAMEYLKGETLTDLLRRLKRMDIPRVSKMMRQVCKSLAEAHQVGIVHRDLKPDNIFITDIFGESDFIKGLDFGIAKSTEGEEQESLTQTGFICGTPRYLSPEQALGKAIDARSDLYSLGVILFEIVSGLPPFSAATPIALVMKHIHEAAPRLPHDGSDRGRWMSALVNSLMQKQPDKRPSSSAAVSAMFDAIVEGREPPGLDMSSEPVRSAPQRPPPRATSSAMPRVRAQPEPAAPPESTIMLDSSDVVRMGRQDSLEAVLLDSKEVEGIVFPAVNETKMIATGEERTAIGVTAMPDDAGDEATRVRGIQAMPDEAPAPAPAPRPVSRATARPARPSVTSMPAQAQPRRTNSLPAVSASQIAAEAARARAANEAAAPSVLVDMSGAERQSGRRRAPDPATAPASAAGPIRPRSVQMPSAVETTPGVSVATGLSEEEAHPMTRMFQGPREAIPVGQVKKSRLGLWLTAASVVIFAGLALWWGMRHRTTEATAAPAAVAVEQPPVGESAVEEPSADEPAEEAEAADKAPAHASAPEPADKAEAESPAAAVEPAPEVEAPPPVAVEARAAEPEAGVATRTADLAQPPAKVEPPPAPKPVEVKAEPPPAPKPVEAKVEPPPPPKPAVVKAAPPPPKPKPVVVPVVVKAEPPKAEKPKVVKPTVEKPKVEKPKVEAVAKKPPAAPPKKPKKPGFTVF